MVKNGNLGSIRIMVNNGDPRTVKNNNKQ